MGQLVFCQMQRYDWPHLKPLQKMKNISPITLIVNDPIFVLLLNIRMCISHLLYMGFELFRPSEN